MATYSQIQSWVKKEYGFVPKTCWIADVKELSGLTVCRAPNRIGSRRMNPCPSNKIEPIRSALRNYRMIS